MSMTDDLTMDFDFDGDDIDRDGGGGMVAEGGCHLAIKSITAHTEKTGDMEVQFEVLAHEKPTELGKTHYEYFRYPESTLTDEANGVRRSILRTFFYAAKLTTPEELKANPRFRVNLALAIGRQCLGKVKHEHFEKKNGDKGVKATLFTKGHWELWAMDNPKGAGIPINAGMAGGNSNGGGGDSSGSGGNGGGGASAGGAPFGDGLDDLIS